MQAVRYRADPREGADLGHRCPGVKAGSTARLAGFCLRLFRRVCVGLQLAMDEAAAAAQEAQAWISGASPVANRGFPRF